MSNDRVSRSLRPAKMNCAHPLERPMNKLKYRRSVMTILMVFAVLGPIDAEAQTPVWTLHTIDPRTETARGADGVRLFDVNGDGLLDVTSGWEEADEARVYLHPGPKKVKTIWPKVTVGRKVGRPEDAVFCDLDGDGAVDVISSGEARRIHFHWAPKNEDDYLKETAWKTEVLPASIKNAGMFVAPQQLDGKNGLDLISGGKNTDLVWFESPKNPRNVEAWKRHTISSACDDGWTMGIYAADMDQDGDSDVVWTTRKGENGGVRWLENPGAGSAQKKPWPEHKISEGNRNFMFGDVADVDGDGRLDVVAPVRNEALHFFQNAGDGNWKDIVIEAPHAKKGAAVGDLDLDGRSDIVVTHVGKAGPVWYSSTGDPSDPASWQRRSTGARGGKSDLVQLYDLDLDGDLDILTTIETKDVQVMWYENPFSKNAPGSVAPRNAVHWKLAFSDVTGEGWQRLWMRDGAATVKSENGGLVISGDGDKPVELRLRPVISEDWRIEFDFRPGESAHSPTTLLFEAVGGDPGGSLSVNFYPENEMRFRQIGHAMEISSQKGEDEIFQPGRTHRIVVTKLGRRVTLEATNRETEKTQTYSASLKRRPAIPSGRIGLRQSGGTSRYSNFTIAILRP